MNPTCRIFGCAAVAVLAACGAAHPNPGAAGSGTAPAGSGAAVSGSMPVSATRFTPSADGVSIGWRRYGQGEPAVVLIHGWAADSTLWRAQLPDLTARYSVVTLDLGGQGTSGANRRTWSLPSFAGDVATVVANLPDAQIILVGAGMGGPVALEAAPLVGPRLRGIIGVETFRTIGQPPPLPSQVNQSLKPFRSDFPGAVRQFVIRTLFHPQADPSVVHEVANLMARTAPERALAQLAELNRLDYASILPAVRAPIVVIDSDLGGAPDAARLSRVAPRLSVITLRGDDSFPMLDDTRRFNAALMQAIDSLMARPDHSAHP
ncbi:MAG TPA: alpha/beta hydrolase [Steroidobacteraceae bacterium]|nr:alpha/beta hydrolase [Steroidobacteraceae bacterium]